MFLSPSALELLALAATLGAGGAMIGLLKDYDGQPVFEWNNISLNAIISILSVAIKALLLFPAAECIGQWKWILLHRRQQNLINFERIDQASRGPFGCFILTWRRDTHFLLRIGLIMTILTTAVDPFSQQLLQFQQDMEYVDSVDERTYALSPRSEPYNLGSIINPRDSLSTSRFTGGTFDVEIRDTQLEFSMEAAILSGLSQPKELLRQQSGVSCPTDNCTWPTFPTLGVCHKCSDLTDQLGKVPDLGDFFNMMWGDDPEVEPGSTRIDIENAAAFALPNGHFLANVNGCSGDQLSCNPGVTVDDQDMYAMTAYSTGNWNKTITFRDVHTLIRSMSVKYLDGGKLRILEEESQGDDTEAKVWRVWSQAPLTATECALYFCIKEIDTRVVGNQVQENATEAKDWRRVFVEDVDFEVSPLLEFIANATEANATGKVQRDLLMDHTGLDGVTTTYMADSSSY